MTEKNRISDPEKKELLSLLLELGEEMYACGAEVNRVEDTLSRIGTAYGAAQMNVFAITSTIVVTMMFGDEAITQSRRILPGGQTDFKKLEDYNALSRRCCRELPSTAEFRKELEKIRGIVPKPKKAAFGNFLASGSFAVFFGGTPADGLVAGLLGLLIYYLSGIIVLKKPNRIITNFLMSLITGMFAIVAGFAFPSLQIDKILIGDIMLLIPGIAMTNAIHDMMEGDTMSGILRLTETILWAAAIAFGFIIPLTIRGGIQ